MRIPSSTSIDRPNPSWVPWFVLFVSLLVTGLAALYVHHSTAAREQARFMGLADAAADQLNGAMDDYAATLRGASGLFASSGAVSADQFDAFIMQLDLATHFPSMRALAYAPRTDASKIAELSALGRQQVKPDFHVWPMHGQSEVYPTFYIEPRDGRPHPGLGFDMTSEPTRWAAICRARDSAAPAATDRVQLLGQPTINENGAFIIYLPIFAGGKIPPTVELRRSHIVGVVYVGFRINDFFNKGFDTEVRDRMQINVFNKAESNGEQQLYDASRFYREPAGFTPHMHETRTVNIAGRTWTLQMSERANFDVESDNPVTFLILLTGCGVSLVLFAVTRGQSLAQESAERSAAALRKSSEALRASQSRLRRLVDSNLIGVFFCNTTGAIIDGNDEFFRLLGRSRNESNLTESLEFRRIIEPQELNALQETFRALGPSGVCPPRETVFVRPDGGQVPVLMGLAMIDGSLTEAVAFTLDLTQRKQAERDLQAAKETAEAASRSKDQFLAVLSHELRTPLTPVLAMTTAARTDQRYSSDIREDFAMIHRNVEMEAKLIDDLLDLTRIGRGKLQLHRSTVDAHQVIKSAIEVCSPGEMVSKNLVIEQELSAKFHYLVGDPARLQQVFWNLFKNAIKFSRGPVAEGGGRITIRTRNDPADSTDAANCTLEVEVVDDGIGIDALELPKIFDAFEQGSAARVQASGGLGLGLAISRGLVEAHGGQIWARSEGAGKGSTFIVRLPTILPVPAIVPTNGESPRAPRIAPLRILLVEDHADTATVLSRLLRHEGHSVDIAGSVAGANRLSAEKTFDLLLSDVGLPDGSGIDVIYGFRGNQRGGKNSAIALTGYGADTDIARTTNAGFDAHLTKPISFKNLLETISRLSNETATKIADQPQPQDI